LLDRLVALELAHARREELDVLQQLRQHYCLYVDAQRWEDLASLLTPDYQHFSTNTVGAEPALVADSAEAFVDRLVRLTAGATTVHSCAMPTLTVVGPGEATGLWAMTDVVSHPSDPSMRFAGRGHYADHYRRSEDGMWRIAVTRLTRQRLDALPLPETDSPPGLPDLQTTSP
jgi:hypothetical protein